MLAVVLHVIEQRLCFFRIAVLRKTKQLAGTVEVNLLVAQLGDQLCDVLGHRSEQRGQSRGAAHNVESLGGDARERQSGQRLVEYIGEQLGLILGDLSHRADHFVLNRTRIRNHYDYEIHLIDCDDLKLPDGDLCHGRCDSNRRVIRQTGEQLAGLLNEVVKLAYLGKHAVLQCVSVLRIVGRTLHQFIHIQSIALR